MNHSINLRFCLGARNWRGHLSPVTEGIHTEYMYMHLCLHVYIYTFPLADLHPTHPEG